MSKQTWEAEFYPVDADRVLGTEGAIRHSLQKWTGLLHANLERHGGWHGPFQRYVAFHEGGDIFVDGETCALCRQHTNDDDDLECRDCPLYQTKGLDCNDDGSAYRQWKDTGDARPMVAALERTLANYLAGGLDDYPQKY